MANVGYGEVIGKVDVNYQFTTDNNNNQAQFTSLWKFLNGPMLSSSYFELVALNYGASANGTDYPDEGNPFGNNAFFCFRFPSGSNAYGDSQRQHDMYLFAQWADTTSFGSSPGNPGLLNAGTGDGLGIAWCFRDDGGNPWNGTSNGDGSDTKGDPVWTDGEETILRIFPKSNADGNSHSTSRQNTFLFDDLSTHEALIQRFYFLADRDNFVMLHDESDDGDAERGFMFGMYDQLDAYSGSIGMPMFVYGENGTTAWDFPDNSTIGTNAGNGTVDGLLIGPSGSTALSSSAYRLNKYALLTTDNNINPNQLFTPATYATYQPAMVMYESPDFGHVGYMSKFFQECDNVARHSVNEASSSAVFANAPRVLLPWSGSVPRTLFGNRNGREFGGGGY
jgi:hypothetical protein